ncbi:MAG: discoidin domain-containing protein, partial [Paramuribaculum sp.]|nr:discoidin domain-containing protein [Paramuribaculum sp.]
WGVGEEARWIGNESGYAGETNWSMQERGTASESANRNCGQEEGWVWLPGESDAKATSAGWFWHSGQTDLSAERLFQMYLETVGRNSNLILNIPPDRSGSLPASSVSTLKSLGTLLESRLGTDLALKASRVEASATRASGANRTYDASNLIDGNKDTYWATNDNDLSASITLTWNEPQTIRYVSLMEYIAKGQRVRGFRIEVSSDGSTWTTMAPNITQSTIGYKRIIPLNGSTSSSYGTGYTAKALRITITDSRACPLLHTISVY